MRPHHPVLALREVPGRLIVPAVRQCPVSSLSTPSRQPSHRHPIMIRTAIVGLGKMGLSHLALLRAHPEIELVAACDGQTYLTGILERYAGLKCYSDFDQLLSSEKLDAILIATPSKLHAAMVEKALRRGLDVFCEKPFVLDLADGERLCALAEEFGRVSQVGYHYRFVGAFQEASRVVRQGLIGRVHHVRVEARGPVVLRTKGSTWRTQKAEGGGVVYDYACHALDLVNAVAGPVLSVSGVVRNSVFSTDVDDEVYCSLHLDDGVSGQLSVNWSDESCRKMETKIQVWGEKGNVKADRQECVSYLREAPEKEGRLIKGWNQFNTVDLTEPVWYYLRGEEYSAQIDHFVKRIQKRETKGVNDFRSALETDRAVAMIHGTLGSSPVASAPRRASGFVDRVLRGLSGRGH